MSKIKTIACLLVIPAWVGTAGAQTLERGEIHGTPYDQTHSAFRKQL